MTYGIRIALLIAVAVLLIHMATNHRYGFHRDELQVIDDARDLAWGYVVYPPLTPAIARLSLELFGPSLVALRFFSALAMSGVIFLAAAMARELGGGDRAQILAAAMTAIAPIVVIQGSLFQYVAFDFLWWVVIAFLLIRVIRTDESRWWLLIGATIGIGMMTKTTMAFWVIAVVVAVLASSLRRHLRSRWLWGGVAISIALYLPNLLWQIGHDFISLDFLSAIHARDVARGRTDGFLVEQLFVPASLFTLPWWVAGLVFCARSREFRPLAILYVVTLALFVVMKGRSYYMGPAYPMLLAAGAVVWERWGRGRVVAAVCVILGALMSGALMLPIAPAGSAWFRFVAGAHDNFAEQIGWPELVKEVASIYRRVDVGERRRTAIFASNYGEAGAINLYGPRYGLPRAISAINSHWSRGYGSPPPETLIILGTTIDDAAPRFRSCEVAGRVSNRWGVENEESRDHPQILLCRGPRAPWDVIWPRIRSFG